MSYEKLDLLILGQWRQGSAGKTEPVINPATGAVLGHVPHASPEDLDEALEASRKGFNIWRDTPAIERQKVLQKAAQLLEARIEEVSRNLTREMGKTLAEARAEMEFAIAIMRWDGEEGKRIYGRDVPSRAAGTRQFVRKLPIGPCVAFVAWNFPAGNVIRKVSGALAAGCSLIIKPSEETPATAIAIGRALTEAGLPDGVLNIVFGVPNEVSEHLLASPIPRKLSFTGSVPVGKHLQRMAADTLKRCTMELGGHAPFLVLDDANLDQAAKMAAAAKFDNAGQVCISPTRFVVHDSVYDAFTERLVDKARNNITVGDGLKEGVTMGALINENRLQAVEAYVNDAVDHGGKLLCGGSRAGNIGTFFEPTILADVPISARMMSEEPFGPLASINRFSDVDAMLAECNRLPYGLSAYAFTSRSDVIERMSAYLETGVLGINTVVVTPPEIPFGGVCESGYGREGGTEGLEAFLQPKMVAFDSTI